jgi:hypothetical protein
MNRKLAVLSLMILFLFAGCKKEKQEFNKNTVRVVTLPVAQGGVLKPTPSNDYLLQGTIIAPSEVEVRDHGFIIGGITYRKLGPTTMIGHFEDTYTSAATVYDNMVVAYLVFTDGDSIRSDRPGSIISSIVSPNALLIGYNVNAVGPGQTTIDITPQWNQSSGYTLYSQTLYYQDIAVSSWSTATLPPGPLFGWNIDSNLPGLFTPGTSYNFKIKTRFNPPSGSLGNPVVVTTTTLNVTYQ